MTSLWLRTAVAGIALACIAGVAPATIVIHYDSLAPNWSLPSYTVEDAWAGCTVLGTLKQRIQVNTDGRPFGSDMMLDFWVNTVKDRPSFLLLSLKDADGGVHTFNDRCQPTVYSVDGVRQEANSLGIFTDADATTWEHVQVDLSQITYKGWPHVAHQFTGEQVIQSMSLRGEYFLVVNEMKLTPVPPVAPITPQVQAAPVPEPGCATLLLTALALRPRRRGA